MSPTAPEPEAVVEAQSRGVGRSIAAVVCVVLAIVLTTPAAIAYWGNRTLTDSARYLDTVGPLVESPEVQDAIATKVITVLEDQVDIEAVLNDVFSGVITDAPRLQRLIGPMSAAIDGLIERQVREFIASDAFAEIWTAVNVRAQQLLVRLLEGDNSGAVSLQGNQVVLDVSDVIDQVKERLVARGLTIAQNIPTPQQDRQIVLLDASQLKKARTAYALAHPVAQWLLVVVAALYVAAVLLARRRARMTVVVGLGIIANALLVAWAVSVGRQLFIDHLSGTTFGPASRAFYDQLLTYLSRGWRVFLWLGLILVVSGWFLGRNRSGTAARTSVAGTLETTGASLSDGPVAGVARWVAPNVRWLRVVAIAVGLLILLWGNQATTGRLFWSVVITLALLALLQVLVGAAAPAAGADGRPRQGLTSQET
jgi:hypothetical protein